ncbi:cytochrome b [Sphingobium nicotianae]|uniref:Cytochrome b n=1 Tax=Sphingobium nicotianae TaxID=2782607 RepID=A0A9X1DDE8_9SPHN|nr:cytochrome b [Sphingobium nicotianae]MBT2187458.1 cytochrome b [Sphingobium nicotianae]
MSSTAAPHRFPPLAIALHWVMVALIAAVYACILLRGTYPRGSDLREGLKTWHFMLGLAVLVLVLVRIVARFVSTEPPIVPEPPAWQMRLARITHLALYAFMVAMPLLGWVALSASGKAIPFFGLHLPALVGPGETLAEQVEEVHETIGTIGYFLIGLHALAALFHHYFLKDDTLRRMLPGRR